MAKVIVLTGGSSGIGQAAARLLAEQGNLVYELSRSGGEARNIRHLTVDLAKEAEIAQAFACIGREAGHIDALINNAGMGISGPVELTESQEARCLFDIDFFSAFLCAKYALPWLRAAGSGARIINISSVAAVFALPYQAFYSAAKAAVSSLTLSLGNELRGFGIQVAALLPGDVRTGFTAVRRKVGGDSLYPGAEQAVAVMERDETEGMAPEILAARIAQLVGKKRLKPFYCCGFKYQFFIFLGRVLPASLANAIVRKMYC